MYIYFFCKLFIQANKKMSRKFFFYCLSHTIIKRKGKEKKKKKIKKNNKIKN